VRFGGDWKFCCLLHVVVVVGVRERKGGLKHSVFAEVF
jgi:hypothetical protein